MFFLFLIFFISHNILTVQFSLHRAAADGNENLVKEILGVNENALHEKNNQGITPLFFAALSGKRNHKITNGQKENERYCRIVHYFLEAGAEVNIKNEYKETPLHYAARGGNIEIIKALKKYGAEVNIQNNQGITPLFITLANGNCLAISQLVSAYSFDINAINVIDENKRTILHYTVLNNLPVLAKRLIQEGANPNAEDWAKNTPLSLALEKKVGGVRNYAMATCLCENGALVDIRLLHRTVFENDLLLLKFLIDKKADLELADNQGKTTLLLAMEYKKEEIITLLLNSGALVNAADKNGKTVLHHAARQGSRKWVEEFIERGLGVDTQDNERLTPLFYAVMGPHSDLIKFLVNEKNACVEVISSENRNLLHYAAYNASREDIDVVEFFVNKGVSINLQDTTGCTPLLNALSSNNYLATQFLLSKGASLEIVTTGGHTPLHYAVNDGDKELVEFVLEKGKYFSLVNAEDESKHTPLFLAVIKGELEKVELLLNKGANSSMVDLYGCSLLDYACKSDSVKTENGAKIIDLLKEVTKKERVDVQKVFHSFAKQLK